MQLKQNIALARMIFLREFRTAYRRTALGPLWALFAPTVYLVVFILFRLMFGLPNPEGLPMIPFLFSGLAIWMLFAGILTASFPALMSNASILKKIPVDPLIFVCASSFLALLTFGIYLILLEGILMFYGFWPSIHHLALPFIGLTVAAFGMGLGLLVASIAMYRQDIVQILPSIIQLGMFATPIFFSASIVPQNLQWVITINPVAHCVNMFRDVLFKNTWPDLSTWALSLLVIGILWTIALPLFRRTTRYLADMY